MAVYTFPATTRASTALRFAKALEAVLAEQPGDKVLDGTLKFTDITNGFRIEITGRGASATANSNHDSTQSPPTSIDIA